MTQRKRKAPVLADLFPSWLIHLQAERKSPDTVRTYRVGVEQFLDWCQQQDRPAVLDRGTVQGFLAGLLDGGAEANTARVRLAALKQFSAWCEAEGEIPENELATLKAAKVDEKITESLDDDQIKRLLKACKGQSFRDRRDEAIFRLMLETGARSFEVLAMEVDEVDLVHGSAVVRRGKGGKGRKVPLGPQTVRALDRYLRARRGHRLADSQTLWLGSGGRAFSHAGLAAALKRRAEDAGIGHCHPHMLRHTAASRWLAAGGTESGLMTLAGWSRRDMIDRYSRSRRESLAADEAKRLRLGDV